MGRPVDAQDGIKNWIRGRLAESGRSAAGAGQEGQVAKIEHCFYCFEALYRRLGSPGDEEDSSGVRPAVDTNSQAIFKLFQEWIGIREFPLFVTWNVVRNRGHPRLRGCIGNFCPSPLSDGLQEYAITSALNDRRFSPISWPELQTLTCTVSLLHSFEDCESTTDWTIGKHGIYIHVPQRLAPIEFDAGSESITPTNSKENSTLIKGRSTDVCLSQASASVPSQSQRKLRNRPRSWTQSQRKAMLSATYLPEVAAEQGWTQVEAIDSAIRKSGWSGQITPAIRKSLIVERYQSSKSTATYQEWQDWRAQVGLQTM